MAKGAYIRLDTEGANAVRRDLDRINNKLNTLGRTGQKAGKKASSGIGALGKDLALGVGAAVVGNEIKDTVNDALDFNNVLGQIQADTGKTNAEMIKMRDSILGTSTAFNAQKEEIVSGIQVFQDFGGIVDEGMSTLDQLTKTHKATGASMADLARIQSTLIQTMGMTPDDAIKGISALNQQSLAGQVALRKLARIIPEVLSLGKGFGFEGDRGINQMGTLLQVAGQATGGKAEESRTLVAAMLRDLTNNADKLKKKFNITVFDRDGSMKNIDDIMRTILTKTKGQMEGKSGLTSIFTADSIKMAAQFKNAFDAKTREFGGTFKNVMKASIDATVADIDKAYRKRINGIASEAQSLSGAMTTLSNVMVKQASETLSFWNTEIFPSLQRGVSSLAEDVQKFLGIETAADKSRKKLAADKAGKYELGVAGVSAIASQARSLTELAKRGQKTADVTIGGQRKRIGLSPESIQQALIQKAEAANIETKNLVSQLRAITREISRQQVVVKPADGLDRQNVKASRGDQ